MSGLAASVFAAMSDPILKTGVITLYLTNSSYCVEWVSALPGGYEIIVNVSDNGSTDYYLTCKKFALVLERESSCFDPEIVKELLAMAASPR